MSTQIFINDTNPYTQIGGVFAQTANSPDITGTTVESTLIDGGEGTLSVPANGFQVGDSFRVAMCGVMDAINNETIQIRVKANSIILLDSNVQTLTSGIVADVWNLAIDFTIRKLGAAGTAEIVSSGKFTYIKTSNGSLEGFGFNTVNSTTFDTTINNTLDITAQWGTNDVGNKIYSSSFILTKIY